MKKQFTSPIIYFISITAALAGILFGFDLGIVSGALLFIQQDFTLTNTLKGLIVGGVLLGAMFGSLGSGYLADQLGRRRILLIISILFIFGTCIVISATTVPFIIIGRFFVGIAIGISSYAGPLYIAEIVPYKQRGELVSFNQLAITLGILCAFFINYLLHPTHSWRLMFATGIIPALFLGIGMWFLPESPRWLVKQGKNKQAGQVLEYLRGTLQIQAEINEIKTSLNFQQATFKTLFSPRILPVLFLGVTLGCLQQITGVNTIIYYAPTIFQLVGFHTISNSILATLGIGIVNIFAALFAIYYVDRIGRRPLLLGGLLGIGLSLATLSLTFHFNEYSSFLRWLALASTFAYIICFTFSLGATLWLLITEIFPLEIRGLGMGISVFSCWLWNFLVSSSFLIILSKLGPAYTFLLFAIFCFLGLIFCYFKVPETKDISLEQIEKNIRAGLSLRKIGAS